MDVFVNRIVRVLLTARNNQGGGRLWPPPCSFGR